MWKSLFVGGLFAATAWGQVQNPQVELANLREDVRGLTQRVESLMLRLEQLERENAELRQKADKSYVTPAQLNEAIAEAKSAANKSSDAAKKDALQQMTVQLEKVAKQTNAALEAIAKGQATRPTVQTTFKEDYPKEGVAYTVQKGDTLADIAKKTGAKTQDIINANKISDPSRINVGQTLFIPGAK
ncbi:MAG: LysM peptidoglycan-binding domain-containing protein [Verrucomicrobiota bacterium]